MADLISGNYTTSIKAKPEEPQQTFTNLKTNGVQAKYVKGADVIVDFARKSVGELLVGLS